MVVYKSMRARAHEVIMGVEYLEILLEILEYSRF
jgi:hypothetical protein